MTSGPTSKGWIVRLILGLIIFTLIVSVKMIIMANLERLGFSFFDANAIRTTWNSFSLELVFYLIAMLISMISALLINIK
ncbi:Uncharacterised protein [Candidatus Tiddalikarchaeum anstoanum]|nr:Uncharacterised protein [Candidatus Tiddalikarchaeum anstoanum]